MTYVNAIYWLMIISKAKLFESALQLCAEFFKALTQPARLAILKYLSETKTAITGDTSDFFSRGRTFVNRHLTKLKTWANENCPTFIGKANYRLLIGFYDPSFSAGTDEFIWSEFVRVRVEIKEAFHKPYIEQIKSQLF